MSDLVGNPEDRFSHNEAHEYGHTLSLNTSFLSWTCSNVSTCRTHVIWQSTSSMHSMTGYIKFTYILKKGVTDFNSQIYSIINAKFQDVQLFFTAGSTNTNTQVLNI